jgi:hypothetical protein
MKSPVKLPAALVQTARIDLRRGRPQPKVGRIVLPVRSATHMGMHMMIGKCRLRQDTFTDQQGSAQKRVRSVAVLSPKSVSISINAI